jgi:predicted enzyme related to lactoylglutathione lyase
MKGAASPASTAPICVSSRNDDPDASLAFYRDTFGFEVRSDVGYEGMRWITVGQEPTEQPYGVRDRAFRDPAGNLIRIQKLR